VCKHGTNPASQHIAAAEFADVPPMLTLFLPTLLSGKAAWGVVQTTAHRGSHYMFLLHKNRSG